MLQKYAKFLWALLALIIGIVVFKVLMATKPELSKQEITRNDPAVRVMLVKPITQTMHVYAQGSVLPAHQANLIPEVSGKVVSLSEQMVNGGIIQAGDNLLAIEDTDYQLQLAQAKSKLIKAEVAKQKAASEFQRIKTLKAKKLASDAQYDKSEQLARMTDAELLEAEIALKQAALNIKRTKITAPFSGRVSSENVEVGQFVSRGEAIATLYSDDVVKVRLPLSSKQLAFLPDLSNVKTESPKVLLEADFSGQLRHWQGRLLRTEAAIDTATRLTYAVVEVNQQDQMNPLPIGLFVKADITGIQMQNIIELPRVALRNNHQVLLVDENNKLHFKTVKVLRTLGDTVMINEGLVAGDKVVVSPMQIVVEGMTIKPIEQGAVIPLENRE